MQLVDKREIKTLNAILFFIKNVKHPTITKILKLLYLLDFKHFKEAGRPVTGQKYFAWKKGPVPPNIYHRLNHLTKDDPWYEFIVLDRETLDEVKNKKRHTLIARRDPDLTVFTKREKKLLENLAFIFEETRPAEISEYSHLKNHPWDITKNKKGLNNEIDYLLAIDDESLLSADEAEELYKESEEMWEKFGSE